MQCMLLQVRFASQLQIHIIVFNTPAWLVFTAMSCVHSATVFTADCKHTAGFSERSWTSVVIHHCRLVFWNKNWCHWCCYCPTSIQHTHTHAHTHTHLTALCPGLPGWAGTRKVKPIWILLKQETVSGSGISWAVCKSAPHSRQITTPAPHRSVFYRPDALPASQPTASKHWRQPTSIQQC